MRTAIPLSIKANEEAQITKSSEKNCGHTDTGARQHDEVELRSQLSAVREA